MPSLTVSTFENDITNVESLAYAILQANQGLIASIIISSSLNGGTIDLSALTSLNGTSEESLTTITVDYGTVTGLSGSLSATGGSAYGLAGFGNQKGETLELTNFTGSITVTASGEAIGVLTRNTGAPAAQTLNVAASTGTITVESTGGNAYGLAADSSSGKSGQNTTSLTFDSMALDVTVTATDTAYGLYSRAACSFTYYDGASHNKAIATMDTGNLSGTIRVTGAKAYGLYVAADVSLFRSASLTVGDITGELTVTATGGDAYGMYSSHDITFGNLSTGTLAVSATENAYGLYAVGKLTGGDYALDISGSGNVYGFYAIGDISLATPTSSTLRLHGGDNGNLFGVYSENGTFSINDYSGEFSLTANGNGKVTLVRASELTVTDFSGSFAATTENGAATALEGSIGTVSGLSGSLSATGGSAYGLAGFGSQNGKALELTNFTGSITATASGEAVGVLTRNTGAPATQTLNVSASTGTITVESTGGNAFGVAADSSSGKSGQNTTSLTFDSMDLDVTVTATDTAYGLYSRAACSFTYYDVASHNKAIASMDTGNLSGTIRVTGAKAYGLYVAADVSLSRTASLTVGNITGEMTVKATGGDAYGLFSSGDLTLNGDITGDISITAETGVAVFISAYNTITYNDEEAATVSGNVVVNGANGAYGFLASGDSHLRITGLLAAGNFQSVGWMPFPLARKYSIYSGVPADLAKIGYAYADGTLNGGSLVMGSSDDDLAIADGAQVIGKISLGGGDNALAIDGGAQIVGDITADTLDLTFNLDTLQSGAVITAAAAGALGSDNTTWTINLADDIRSGRYVLATVEDGLDAEAMANLTVTVNAFGETHEITFADDMDKFGVMDINVTEFGEIEFVYADTFFGIRHNIRNSAIVAENNGAITLYFSRKLDAASFDVDMITLTDGDGNAVAITGYEIDGAALHLEYDPIAVSGDCTLTVSSRLKDVDGNRLDQNVDKVGGGADDAFTIELTADGDVSGLPVGKPEDLHGTADGLSWTKAKYARQYLVVCSPDNYQHTLEVAVPTNGLDTFGLPTATYKWRVLAIGNYEWVNGEDFASEAAATTPQLVQPEANGLTDLIFVSVHGTWSSSYHAVHVGGGEWTGTEQTVQLAGKNLIDGVYVGGDDASLLLLTDDDNGDALFMDDIYSAFPEGVDVQARVAKIDEIRAGAGNDIVDLTSQQFDYVGDGMIVRGGLGDDVIWANKGENRLFGDAGDDCIVGGADNDVIIGGAGDDTLHGGGGDDLFAFGYDLGHDTVEQLTGGKVTLWFAYGDASKWDDGSLTYTDGDRSVTVSGVALEDVTLKFGDDGTEQYELLQMAGAFDDSAHAQIFEDNTRGMLA